MKLPETIGPYRTTGILADDGLSLLVLARANDRMYVLRTYPLEPYLEPESRERLKREILLQKSIHHENVWEVLEYGFYQQGIPYLVMDDFGGQTLWLELRQKGPFPLERWRQVMTQILSGLQAIHAAEVVHRQLGTDRIWLTRDGVCKIYDFGLSSGPGQSRLTPSGVSLGRPDYTSPEQLFNAHHADGRTDLYSAGVVGYELLTGHLPIETPTTAERLSRLAGGDLDPVDRWRSDVPQPLSDWLSKLLASSRDRRYEDAASALAAL